MSNQIVTRFSPSPTGLHGLHLGSLRTALTSYILAKQNNGKFIVRIEDTDKARSLKETETKIMDAMKWLGLSTNEPITRQSDNSKYYDDVCNGLITAGFAYYCKCSVHDLQAIKAHQIKTKARIGYPSKCIDEGHTSGVLRLNVKKIAQAFSIKKVEVNDNILGVHHVDYRDVSDVVLLRADGSPTYILANTADDVASGVTYVTRGADLYPQTATQIMITFAIQHVLQLKKKAMDYAHLPLITDAKKQKLSKRDPDTKGILDYKRMGFLPDAVMQFALSLGNKSIPLDIPMSLSEMVESFDISKSRASNTAYLEHTLDYVNRLHIRKMPSEELSKMLSVKASPALIELFKYRADNLVDLNDTLESVLRAVTEHPEDVVKLQIDNFSSRACIEFRKKRLAGLPTAPLDRVVEALIA